VPVRDRFFTPANNQEKMKTFTKLVLSIGALLGAVVAVHAAVPVEITSMVTDATTVWESVKVFILAVMVFGILVRVAMKMKKAS